MGTLTRFEQRQTGLGTQRLADDGASGWRSRRAIDARVVRWAVAVWVIAALVAFACGLAWAGPPHHPTATPCPPVTATPWPTATDACIVPTPLATPLSRDKGECCKEVAWTYRLAKRALAAHIAAERKKLVAWKQAQMRECREEY